MKRIVLKSYFLFFLLFALILVSCEEEVPVPEILEFSTDITSVKMGEPIYFTIEHTGTYAVIWTGETGANYNEHEIQITNPDGVTDSDIVKNYDQGAIVTGNVYQKRYREIGTFTAILLVTNVGDLGHKSERVMSSVEVTVTE